MSSRPRQSDAICGVIGCELRAAAGDLCAWPSGQVVTVSLVQPIVDLRYAVEREIHRKAWSAWEKVCGLQVEFLDDPNPRANVAIYSKRIDRPGRVLAWSELPCGNVGPRTTLNQMFDTSENWDLSDDGSGEGISLYLTSVHEAGHAIGLPHGPDGCVMYYRANWVSELCGWELREAQERYQDSTPVPAPSPFERILECVVRCLDEHG